MAVIDALARVATGYDPDKRSREQYGYLGGIMGEMADKKKMQNAGKEIIDLLQRGEGINQRSLLSVAQKYKLKPEQFKQILGAIDKSGAMEQTIRQRKLVQEQVPRTDITYEKGGLLKDIFGPEGMRHKYGWEASEPAWSPIERGEAGGLWQTGPEGQRVRRAAPEKPKELTPEQKSKNRRNKILWYAKILKGQTGDETPIGFEKPESLVAMFDRIANNQGVKPTTRKMAKDALKLIKDELGISVKEGENLQVDWQQYDY